jgi:membrane protein YqaA with SNARE-associated domain
MGHSMGAYLLVFLGAFVSDVVPIPFPPAFTVMTLLLLRFHLSPWLVVIVGVAGSVLGRFLLTLYIPKLSGKFFKTSKREDVEYLGSKLKEGGWKSQLAVLAYSLLPLPTTPLFVAAGMAKVSPLTVIPGFFVGKFVSDSAMIFLGTFAVSNTHKVLSNLTWWKSIVSLLGSLLLLGAVLFVDWRSLIQKKKLSFKFAIWK